MGKRFLLTACSLVVALIVLSMLVEAVLRKSENSTRNGTKSLTNVDRSATFEYSFSNPSTGKLMNFKDLSAFNVVAIPMNDLKIFTTVEGMNKYLDRDFFCNASGPIGSTECKNRLFESFQNRNGVKGYKLYRTVTKVIPFNVNTYEEIVYILPFNNEANSSVLFALKTDSIRNSEILDRIVDSYSLSKD